MTEQQAATRSLRDWLRFLYEEEHPTAQRFRYGLLVFDVVTIVFIVVTSFLDRTPLLEAVDVLFGLAIFADFGARLLISRTRLADLLQPATWADAIAIASFLAPLAGEGAGFLRVLRTLRLLHTFQVLARLRSDSSWFRRNEEVTITLAHLAVFLFVMTAIVYETQHWSNPEIKNYIDALYFTVTALTTTGFGDITLTGTLGRLISVVIMIFGVTHCFCVWYARFCSPSRCALPIQRVGCSAMTMTLCTAKPVAPF
jgi:voltage-gated potassium channel